MITDCFITGANGFIGASLARKLSAAGSRLGLLCRRPPDHPFLRGLPAAVTVGDILDTGSYLQRLGSGITVIHCAARVSFAPGDRREVLKVNLEGTRRLLSACRGRGVKDFVFVSAAAVWEPTRQPAPITEDSPAARPRNAYAAGKMAAEEECRAAAAAGMRVVIVNPVTAYGEGDYRLRAGGRVIKEFLCRGRRLAPPGGTSWIDIDDLTSGIIAATEKGLAGRRYILSGGNVTYRELFAAILAAAGSPGRVYRLPRAARLPLCAALAAAGVISSLLGRQAAMDPGQMAESFFYKYYSPARAARELGFRPSRPLAEAISRTLDFNRRHHL